ncbi:hypothetical protein P153DRAFT_338703 [Dothidotthia symphoricarpi CBS 119687]|uniref:Glyoxalase-like domain-containing protein n=1 Tax=Dothidotthia symphoricarpi CBS 119687 TaxID=1392245 RepID=A0A6A6AID7_9PLEO|nr:uncharacterized protein P153DRAFT_338703 [Dothidotthia symphoricarpi CBS 119687]KAF2130664.1 hypothetical protein P153DRAFT_338703 [Dothidotthia symphoricarpi CBS 119687]
MPPPTQSLDHLILFVPADPTTNLPRIPPVFAQNFTLTPGGFHADGLTSNVLILLSDGCYIELISFIAQDHDLVSSHWWGPDAAFTGWKDWCLTNGGTAGGDWEALAGSYGAPIRGARKRDDGVDVQWAVTFPTGANGGQASRGRVPFFCHDVTPREVRVPLDGVKTGHACGAVGVRGLTVLLRDQEMLDDTRRVYGAVFGDGGVVRGDEVWFSVSRVESVEGVEGGARIVLRLPRSEEERGKVEKSGFWYGDVVLVAKAGGAGTCKEKGRRERLDVEGGVGGLWIEWV